MTVDTKGDIYPFVLIYWPTPLSCIELNCIKDGCQGLTEIDRKSVKYANFDEKLLKTMNLDGKF